MKIAFLILSCDYPINQFELLLDKLFHFEDPIIYVHHDYHQNDFDKKIIKKYNLIFPKNYYRTYWSHINNVRAMWDGFKYLMETNNPDWIFTLTPTCYPIKSSQYIQTFLNNTDFDGFMSYRKVTNIPNCDLDKWIYRDMYHKKIMIPIIKRPIYIKRKKSTVPFNDHFPIWHSSNYFTINKKACNELLKHDDVYNNLVNFYENFVGGAQQHPCPQEIVLQSILLNNSSNLKICNNYYRYIKWLDGIWSPIYLSMNNYQEIVDSDAWFARKFKSPQSDDLINKINCFLLN